MAIIRAYTTIEQSRKLAEILPLESADMYFWYSGKRHYIEAMDDGDFNEGEGHIRAWSLAALLGVLPNENMLVKTTDGEYYCLAKDVMTKHYNNSVDACVSMIEKLHELKML